MAAGPSSPRVPERPVTTAPLVMVHTVSVTDPTRLKAACVGVTAARQLVFEVCTEMEQSKQADQAAHWAQRLAALSDAQRLLDELVHAALTELASNAE